MICTGMERGDDASRVVEATFFIPSNAFIRKGISPNEDRRD